MGFWEGAAFTLLLCFGLAGGWVVGMAAVNGVASLYVATPILGYAVTVIGVGLAGGLLTVFIELCVEGKA